MIYVFTPTALHECLASALDMHWLAAQEVPQSTNDVAAIPLPHGTYWIHRTDRENSRLIIVVPPDEHASPRWDRGPATQSILVRILGFVERSNNSSMRLPPQW